MCQHPFLAKFLVCQRAFGDPGSGVDTYIGVTFGIVAAYINLAAVGLLPIDEGSVPEDGSAAAVWAADGFLLFHSLFTSISYVWHKYGIRLSFSTYCLLIV